MSITEIDNLKNELQDIVSAKNVWYDSGCRSCGTQWVFETNYPRKIFNNKISFRIMLREKSGIISLIEYRKDSTSIHFINFNTIDEFKSFFIQLK